MRAYLLVHAPAWGSPGVAPKRRGSLGAGEASHPGSAHIIATNSYAAGYLVLFHGHFCQKFWDKTIHFGFEGLSPRHPSFFRRNRWKARDRPGRRRPLTAACGQNLPWLSPDVRYNLPNHMGPPPFSRSNIPAPTVEGAGRFDAVRRRCRASSCGPATSPAPAAPGPRPRRRSRSCPRRPWRAGPLWTQSSPRSACLRP